MEQPRLFANGIQLRLIVLPDVVKAAEEPVEGAAGGDGSSGGVSAG